MIIKPKHHVRRVIGERIYYVVQDKQPCLIEINQDADHILSMVDREMDSSELLQSLEVSNFTIKELDEFLADCCESGILLGAAPTLLVRGDAEKDHGETVVELEEYSAKNRIPVAGSIEMTTQCNLRCKHCYLGSTHKATGDMPLEAWLDKLVDVVDAGCLWLSITGGDPFLSRSFDPVYRMLADKGVITTVLSNGTTLTEDYVALLQECPPRKVELSIYGYSRDVYESVTGVSGSYIKFRNGIEMLLDAGISVELKGILLSYNYHELDLMKGFAEDIGVYFRASGETHEMLDGSDESLACRVSPEEVARADFKLPERRESIKGAVRDMHSPKNKRIYQCQAGQNGFHIDHSGVIHPCITERSIGFSLMQHSFSSIWRHYLPMSMMSSFTGEEKCYSCEKYSLCRVCPAKSRISTGVVVHPVPFLCRLADECIKLATVRR